MTTDPTPVPHTNPHQDSTPHPITIPPATEDARELSAEAVEAS